MWPFFVIEFFEEMSKEVLREDASQDASPLEMHDYTQASLEANDRALGLKQLRAELDKGFDVVLMEVFSEAGYHLAHRSTNLFLFCCEYAFT